MYVYGGRFYAVPETFKFPTVRLRDAIRFWLMGMTVSTDGKLAVRPFKKITLEMLPNHLKATFRMHWTPLFKFLESAINLPVDNISDDIVDDVYKQCLDYLKATVSYCFRKTLKGDPLKYTLSTWCNRISHATIMKHGTVEDKAKLQHRISKKQVPKKAGLKRKKQPKTTTRYPHRQKQKRGDNTPGQRRQRPPP